MSKTTRRVSIGKRESKENVVGPLLSKKWELGTKNMKKPSSYQSLPARLTFRNPQPLRPGGRAGARNMYLGGRGLGQGIFKGFHRCI